MPNRYRWLFKELPRTLSRLGSLETRRTVGRGSIANSAAPRYVGSTFGLGSTEDSVTRR